MKTGKQLPCWAIAALFPAVLFYYEIVLRIATGHSFPTVGTVYMALFCLGYGAIGYLLATLFKKKKVSYTVTLVYLIVTAAPFLIEYFVYRQFNVFYDISTCLNGAADALSDYVKELMGLIFSVGGLTNSFLLLLPTVLFAIFGKDTATPKKLPLKKWVSLALAVVVLFFAIGFGISDSNALSMLFDKEYNFQSMISNVGLLTSLRMDVVKYFGPQEVEEFEAMVEVPQIIVPTTEPAATQSGAEETVPEQTEPVVYEPNVMDIDFASLDARGTVAQLNQYVASLTPSMKNEYTGLFEGKNLILITAEAFTPEIIDPELTPTLYRLYTKGIQFTDFYQPTSCGTIGGEFQNIFGMPPARGGSSFPMTQRHNNYFTMGSQLDRLGYYGAAYHNHDYTYYDRHLSHNNLGYSEGFTGDGNGLEDKLSNYWPLSDVELFTATVPTYINKQPFNIYYMTYSGHSVYTRNGNSFSNMHYDRVSHLDYPEVIKCYLAAQLEFEDAMAYLMEELEKAGILNDTVICISSDHFPYGLDLGSWSDEDSNLSKLFGFPTTNYIERDHNGLILWCGILEEMDPIVVDTPACSVDILPTLSNLFGTEYDSRLMVGRDVFSDAMPLMFNIFYDWKTEYGSYHAGSKTFYPADESIEIPEGYVESVKTLVRNKIKFAQGVLDTNYFGYLFGKP